MFYFLFAICDLLFGAFLVKQSMVEVTYRE